MLQQVIEETLEMCPACGGRGYVPNPQITSGQSMCQRCGSAGYIVTKRTVRTIFGVGGSLSGQ